MRIGIDYVSLVLFVIGWAVSRIPVLPLWARHAALAVACGLIAAWRISLGASGLNVVFVVLAAGLAVAYGVQALRARDRR